MPYVNHGKDENRFERDESNALEEDLQDRSPTGESDNRLESSSSISCDIRSSVLLIMSIRQSNTTYVMVSVVGGQK